MGLGLRIPLALAVHGVLAPGRHHMPPSPCVFGSNVLALLGCVSSDSHIVYSSRHVGGIERTLQAFFSHKNIV